jgi:hypothetical protein
VDDTLRTWLVVATMLPVVGDFSVGFEGAVLSNAVGANGMLDRSEPAPPTAAGDITTARLARA